MSRRLLSVAGLALCAALALAGCGGGGKPRPDLIFVSTKSGVYDIYAMNADGKRQTRLTRGKRGNASSGIGVYYAMDPDWSHDGKQIAFWSARDGAIVTVDPNGQSEQVITNGKDNDSSPDWNPIQAPKKTSKGGY